MHGGSVEQLSVDLVEALEKISGAADMGYAPDAKALELQCLEKPRLFRSFVTGPGINLGKC